MPGVCRLRDARLGRARSELSIRRLLSSVAWRQQKQPLPANRCAANRGVEALAPGGLAQATITTSVRCLSARNPQPQPHHHTSLVSQFTSHKQVNFLPSGQLISRLIPASSRPRTPPARHAPPADRPPHHPRRPAPTGLPHGSAPHDIHARRSRLQLTVQTALRLHSLLYTLPLLRESPSPQRIRPPGCVVNKRALGGLSADVCQFGL